MKIYQKHIEKKIQAVDLLTIDYISKRENTTIGHPVIIKPRLNKGDIDKGDTVKVVGTTFNGTYKINKVWLDGNDRIGALYLDIRYTPKGLRDETFKNVGKIQILK